MLDRMVVGDVAAKHHVELRGPDGALRHEECLTRAGFDGPYTILYHQHRPHTHRPMAAPGGWDLPTAAPEGSLAKRHFRSGEGPRGGAMSRARTPLLFNGDVVVGAAFPDREDACWIVDGDADELIFVLRGGGRLVTPLGTVHFQELDYVFVPRGPAHRWIPRGEQHWLTMDCRGGVGLPEGFRNGVGQLRMDAPLCHRDFRRPEFTGVDELGPREVLVKRGDRFHGFALKHAPTDVVGWDGTVYPWAFPIMNFQPRTASVHLPPTWHGTFQARGALICSFVPRMVDFGSGAIPCPYPHSSVDVDEVLFYCRGDFTSRRGVGPGSLSMHPAGIPHGPHPGAYEGSLGEVRTDELAVMLDCFEPLTATVQAAAVEDTDYMGSFAA